MMKEEEEDSDHEHLDIPHIEAHASNPDPSESESDQRAVLPSRLFSDPSNRNVLTQPQLLPPPIPSSSKSLLKTKATHNEAHADTTEPVSTVTEHISTTRLSPNSSHKDEYLDIEIQQHNPPADSNNIDRSHDTKIQEHPPVDSRGSRPFHMKNMNLRVLSEIGRRRYVHREPYQWLSRRSSDSSLSDDSKGNRTHEPHTYNIKRFDSSSGVDTLDTSDQEEKKESFPDHLKSTHPPLHTNDTHNSIPSTDPPISSNETLFEGKTYSQEEWILIERFWKAYDEVLILALFSILGILFRLLFARWFSVFNSVFNENSALFTNLPLNCFSCWLMGLLCSGNDALDIVFRKMGTGVVPREDRTRSRTKSWSQQQDPTLSPPSPSRAIRDQTMMKNKLAQSEMRDVQVMALERRIRASHSLVLFPATKQDIDVIEHYSNGLEDVPESYIFRRQHSDVNKLRRRNANESGEVGETHSKQDINGMDILPQSSTISIPPTANFSYDWKKLSRVNIADGWDVGTTADAMKDGILLGLRVGFCGALSSFSSWNSDMVSLLCNGYVDAAIVGYILGLLVPIVCYRIGQHAAVYVFVGFALSLSHHSHQI